MKLGAHPMVVAVAFGLLSPLALAEERLGEERCAAPLRTACEGCTCGFDEAMDSSSDVADPSELIDVSALGAAFDAMQR